MCVHCLPLTFCGCQRTQVEEKNKEPSEPAQSKWNWNVRFGDSFGHRDAVRYFVFESVGDESDENAQPPLEERKEQQAPPVLQRSDALPPEDGLAQPVIEVNVQASSSSSSGASARTGAFKRAYTITVPPGSCMLCSTWCVYVYNDNQ